MEPQPPYLFRVFLSSPGDVVDERNLARKVVRDELPVDPFLRGKVAFDIFSWDDPVATVPMLANMTPQAAVDRGLIRPSQCDFVVVVLWSRMGTPLPDEHRRPNGERYLSGTEWEFDDAYNAASQPEKPKILVYRRMEEPVVKLTDPDRAEKLEQWDRLQQFFARFKNPDGSLRGGIQTYMGPSDFAERLRSDLRTLIADQLPHRLPENSPPSAHAAAQPWSGSPYPGLRSFTTEEAPIFFGRGQEVDALISRLRDPAQRFVAVVGASGTGKSSLIRAGLLPRLGGGAIEGSEHWQVLSFTPGAMGADPFLALAVELRSLLPPRARKPPIALADELRAGPQHLSAYLDIVLKDGPAGAVLLLFTDQFEELFAPVAERHRSGFLQLLAHAAGDRRLRVVATIRADFLPQCIAEPALATLLQAPGATFPLGPPGPAALADMIRKPAERAGLDLDHGLVDAILRDAGGDAGALPLIAFCLEELYRRNRAERRLTLESYHALEGLRGAIRRRADALLADFQEREKGADIGSVLPQLFGALVQVDAAGAATRRRALRDELMAARPPIPALVETLIRGHLLRGEDVGARAVVTLAHEALIDAWPSLSNWLELNRARLQRLQRLWLSLAAPEPEDRRYAAEALGGIGPAAVEAVPRLITALGDTDELVRRSAAVALGDIGPAATDAIPALVAALGDVDDNVSWNAASALGRMGPGAVPVLIAALEHANANVRSKAAQSLGNIGPDAAEAVPALLKALGDSDPGVTSSVVDAMAEIGPAAVPALVAALGNVALQIRQLAAMALGHMGQEATDGVPALTRALGDAHAWVRYRAAEALGDIGSGAAVAVPGLIAALRDGIRDVRSAAMRALGRIGPAAAAAVPLLMEALVDADADIRRYATTSLSQIGSAAVPALVEALGRSREQFRWGFFRRPDEEVPRCAAVALRDIGPAAATAVPALTTALDKGSRILRRCAAEALGRLGPAAAAAVPALMRALGHSDPSVRASAAQALAGIGPDAAQALPALIKALRDRSETIRQAAAAALGAIGPGIAEAATPALIEALADAHSQVRLSAAGALSRFGPLATAAGPALLMAVRDADVDLRRAAVDALGEIRPTGPGPVAMLMNALRDTSGDVRHGAAQALGKFGPMAAPAVPMLIPALDDADGRVPASVATALGRIGPAAAGALLALVKALDSGDPNLRSSAALAIGSIGPAVAEALPALTRTLDDADADVRRSAALALGRMGPAAAEALPALVRAVANADESLRGTAAFALGAIGPGKANALPALTRALGDADAFVRLSAALALGRIGPAAIPALIEALDQRDENVRRSAALALGRIGPAAANALPALSKTLGDADADVRSVAAEALKRIERPEGGAASRRSAPDA